jgi:glyoxylase-like metal-dependent hydrolase (beta-lactamase superfamily II)
MQYRIVPLNVGNFEALPKQSCMYRMHREITYPAPCVIWYIQGTKGNIVVDLGPQSPEQCLMNHGMVINKSENQLPVNACKSAGFSADDVKTVILTHLHWDHVGAFSLFRNAQFVVQKKEIECAINPLPCFRWLYYEKSLGKPEFVDYLDRIDAIEGDSEIETGVDVIAIPSHTPGFQGVLVNCETNKYFIAGDAVGLYECWETVPHVPSGLFVNLQDYYKSHERIEQLEAYVLPGHDPRVFERPFYS